jgi:Calcineurin-like phosphoesterase
MRRAAILFVVISAALPMRAQEAPVVRPRSDAVTFVVIGDSGTGDRAQYDVARQMTDLHARVPLDMVIMLGDNIYGSQTPQDFALKFERPYKPLLDAGVRFYASLGNHDNASNRFYPAFNMQGQRYYSYAARNVRFFALDSDYIDDRQRSWLESALRNANDDWKVCFFHHPLYSDGGRHGSQIDLRVVLEPLFTKYGVNVVFSGHDHVYERLKPQKGIQYFVSGAAGQLRRGDVRPSAITAAAFDKDQSFMVVQVAGDELGFEAISRTGMVVDSGIIRRESKP